MGKDQKYVRSTKEVRANQLEFPNVLAIPLNELRERINQVPKEKEIVIICPLGIRAYEAAWILQGIGFTEVTILAGGLKAVPEDLI